MFHDKEGGEREGGGKRWKERWRTSSELDREVEGLVTHFAKHFSFVFWVCIDEEEDTPHYVRVKRGKSGSCEKLTLMSS